MVKRSRISARSWKVIRSASFRCLTKRTAGERALLLAGNLIEVRSFGGRAYLLADIEPVRAQLKRKLIQCDPRLAIKRGINDGHAEFGQVLIHPVKGFFHL